MNPEAVVEKYWPGAVEILKARKMDLRPDHFWPVARIRKARLVLGWEPEDTFEKWLSAQGWQSKD